MPRGKFAELVSSKSNGTADMSWFPAYTAGELLEILPERIPAKYLSELFEIPVITAAGGDEWEKQNEVREQELNKLKHFMRDWDDFNPMYDIDDLMVDNEKWPYDLLLAYQPGRSVYYYADDAEAEYWQIAVNLEFRDKHDNNPCHLLGRLFQHLLETGVLNGDNGQGKLI